MIGVHNQQGKQVVNQSSVKVHLILFRLWTCSAVVRVVGIAVVGIAGVFIFNFFVILLYVNVC